MYTRAPDVPKLNIPRSIHPGIAVKINGSPALHTRLVSEVSVSFTIPLNRQEHDVVRLSFPIVHFLPQIATFAVDVVVAAANECIPECMSLLFNNEPKIIPLSDNSSNL